MSQWYYSKNGQQIGPVELADLREMLHAGSVDGGKELAWTTGMADWVPISRIAELQAPAAAPQASLAPVIPGSENNPYAAPASTWAPPEPVELGERQEIVPGSEPLDPIACLKRAWEVMSNNVATVVVLFVVWLVAAFAIGMAGGLLEVMFGVSAEIIGGELADGLTERGMVLIAGNVAIQMAMAVPSIWLAMGLIRGLLNLADGRDASLNLLFGEGPKLLRGLGATFVYYVIVMLGMLVLIVPGIYLAMRLYFSRMAIVDRNMGAMESLSYSWRLTERNGLPLLAYWVLAFLLIIAGALMCLVGLIVAVPWATLSGMVVFRWLQYGRRGLSPAPPGGSVDPTAGSVMVR